MSHVNNGFPAAQWSTIRLLSRRCRFDPWAGKISWTRKWLPTPVIMPGKSHGQRSLVGYGPWGLKESDLTEQLNKKKNMLMITAEVTKHLLCARREATGFANLNHSSNSWTSKETAAFHRLHSRVDMPLMKPQIRSQRAHDPKKNHQACCVLGDTNSPHLPSWRRAPSSSQMTSPGGRSREFLSR